MSKLSVELSAALVNVPVAPLNFTKVELVLRNSTGRLTIKDLGEEPRSLHQFVVKDASDFGCGGCYNLSQEEATDILTISCSLVNPRILFSTQQATYRFPSMEYEPVPPKVETISTPTGPVRRVPLTVRQSAVLSTCTDATVELNEEEIIDVAGRLLAIRPFVKRGRTLPESNSVQAIARYAEATRSGTAASCYQSLYHALEQAVNADGTDYRGNAFDNIVYSLTGLSSSEVDVEELRKFNNRIKHALCENRHDKDLETLEAGKQQLGKLTLDLKRAADAAILNRI